MLEASIQEEIYAHKNNLRYKIDLKNKLKKLQSTPEFKEIFDNFLFKTKLTEYNKQWIKSNTDNDELSVRAIIRMQLFFDEILKEGEDAKQELKQTLEYEDTHNNIDQ